MLTREMSGNGTGEVFKYDLMGHVVLEGDCRPSQCGSSNDWLNYSYDLGGNLLTSTDGNNVTSTYTYTAANELMTLTSSQANGQNPAAIISSAQQSPFGPSNIQFGNGVGGGVNSFDTLGRFNGQAVCAGSINANCSGGSQLDGSNVTWQGKRATAASDLYAGISYSFGYDDMNRLGSTVANGNQTYSYGYDRWGNRRYQTPGTNIDSDVHNHLDGFPYDAAGNLMADASGNGYTYDAEGNVLEVTGNAAGTILYTYDALNQRVRVDTGSSYQEYDFNLAGQRVSTWTGPTTNVQGQYYAGGRVVAYYSDGATHFQHQDWLGTTRLRTTYSGSVEGRFSQAAFGDNFQSTGTDTDTAHYAGQDADSNTDTSHARFRELAPRYGRWMSPDPYDGSYHFGNPQTLNRYTYALNNPLVFIDPTGLDCTGGTTYDPNSGLFYDTSNQAGCEASGGHWDDGGGGEGDDGSGQDGNPMSLCQQDSYQTCVDNVEDLYTIQGAPGIGCGLSCSSIYSGFMGTDPMQGDQGSSGGGGGAGQAPYSFAAAARNPLDPQQCQALANKINNLLKQIADKQDKLNTNPRVLPQWQPGPLSGHVQGHQQLLGKYIDDLAVAANTYYKGCGGGPPAAPTNGSLAPRPVPIIVPPILMPMAGATEGAAGAAGAAEGVTLGEVLEWILGGLLAM